MAISPEYCFMISIFPCFLLFLFTYQSNCITAHPFFPAYVAELFSSGCFDGEITLWQLHDQAQGLLHVCNMIFNLWLLKAKRDIYITDRIILCGNKINNLL